MKSKRLLGFLVISMGIAAAQTPASVGPESISDVFASALATQPVQAGSTTLSHTYTIAHFPYGGGWSTRLMLANSGTSQATVEIAFYNQAGAPALVPLEGGQGLQGTQHLIIAPNQVQVVGTDPAHREAGSTTVTWASAASNVPLNIFSLFDDGPSAAVISGAVGAQSTSAAKTFRFPVSVYGPLHYNAGVAVANPNQSATTVTVKLVKADGTTLSSIEKNLPANGQTSFVVTESTAFLHDIDASTLFNGSIAVCASQPVGLVAIGIEGGALFSTAVSNDPCP